MMNQIGFKAISEASVIHQLAMHHKFKNWQKNLDVVFLGWVLEY